MGNNKETYCKRCGAITTSNLNVQLTPKILTAVCQDCFLWTYGKTQSEIKKDIKKRGTITY